MSRIKKSIVLGFIIGLVYLLASGCSSKCQRKLCCPKEGHGPCPICPNESLVLNKIRNGKLIIK